MSINRLVGSAEVTAESEAAVTRGTASSSSVSPLPLVSSFQGSGDRVRHPSATSSGWPWTVPALGRGRRSSGCPPTRSKRLSGKAISFPVPRRSGAAGTSATGWEMGNRRLWQPPTPRSSRGMASGGDWPGGATPTCLRESLAQESMKDYFPLAGEPPNLVPGLSPNSSVMRALSSSCLAQALS